MNKEIPYLVNMTNRFLKKPLYCIVILLALLFLYDRIKILYDSQQAIVTKVKYSRPAPMDSVPVKSKEAISTLSFKKRTNNSYSKPIVDIVTPSVTVKQKPKEKSVFKSSKTVKRVQSEKTDLKYILEWTSPSYFLFTYMEKGRQRFIDRKCPYTNCIVTADRSLLGDYSKFDVIAFAGPKVFHMYDLPKRRSPHQKYVFATTESAHNYPVCSNRFDGFFNWTWTYKLDSEVRWGYMYIRDKSNAIVGPNKQMNWMKLEDMEPISEEFKKQLSTKTKAAAWFVSNCYSKSRREHFVKSLQSELNKYNLEVDVYGGCGRLSCFRNNEERCDQLIKDKYYFYLSFENAFSEDYATEKLWRALKNDAIPVVYGGADYSRFMPDGIYLNARKLGVENLARKMNELIQNPEKYYEYFKWKKYYSYHQQHTSVHTEPYCLFCTHLNDREMVEKTTIYQDFRKWWDPPNTCFL